MTETITQPWESWGERPDDTFDTSALAVSPPEDGVMAVGCLVYDEALATAPTVARDLVAVDDADTDAAYKRTGDGGPYVWQQGPQEVTEIHQPEPSPPTVPTKPPKPVPPGKLPRRGQAVTTSNVRLRAKPGADQERIGVIPAASSVELTGGVRKIGKNTWRRIRYVPESAGAKLRLSGDDRWITGSVTGWVNDEYLAFLAFDASYDGFPRVTHQWIVAVEDSKDVPLSDLLRSMQAIFDDPRGYRRAGLSLIASGDVRGANVVLRIVDVACGWQGVAGCAYRRSGETPRCDIVRKYYGTMWFARVLQHEAVGHSALRCYDHYDGAPDYPRPEYSGIMGNWQDDHGSHNWPDQDDIDQAAAWLAGKSPNVKPRP